MLRRFKFEDEVYESLSCVPMAARRKLDRVGLKISLKQWQQLGRGERLAICHLPADSAEECEALQLLVAEAVRNRCGVEAKELPLADREAAEPPATPTAVLIERAKGAGFALGPQEWNRLDQQYDGSRCGGEAFLIEFSRHQSDRNIRELLGADSDAGS